MLVFSQKNLAFLSMPKTASTSYIHALSPYATITVKGPPNFKHMSLQKFDKVLRPVLEHNSQKTIETLAVIRHPLDWMSSWYRYRLRDSLDCSENSTAGITFDEFVEHYMRNDPPRFARIGNQSSFLKPAGDRPKITHLFQYEDQISLVEFLKNRLEKEFELPVTNVSPKIRVQISPETEKKSDANVRINLSFGKMQGPTKYKKTIVKG